MHRFLVQLVLVLSFADVSAAQTTRPAAEDSVARALATLRQGGSIASADGLAGEVGSLHRWDAVPALLRALAEHEERKHPDPVLRFILRGLVAAADGDDEMGVRLSGCWGIPDTEIKLAMMVVAERAADSELKVLVDMATRPYRSERVGGLVSVVLCGHLRGRDSPDLPQRLEDAVEKGLSRAQAFYLRALMASRRYRRETLKTPDEQAAHLRFERSFWREWALTPVEFARPNDGEQSRAASRVVRELGEVDGRFLLRLFKEVETTSDEMKFAIVLMDVIRPLGLKGELHAIARSTSPKARWAEAALRCFEPRPEDPSQFR